MPNKNGVDPAQVLISWAVQKKTVVLPKSVTESRLVSNLKTFELSAEDFDTLNKLSEKRVSLESLTLSKFPRLIVRFCELAIDY